MKAFPVTYTDFNGETRTETLFFNLSESELIDMELSTEGGMEKKIQAIVNSNDPKELMGLFKDLIVRSYGIKSDDGRRFIKNDKIREDFLQSAVYNKLLMDLITSEDDLASEFVNGIIPDMDGLEEAAKRAEKNADTPVIAPVS